MVGGSFQTGLSIAYRRGAGCGTDGHSVGIERDVAFDIGDGREGVVVVPDRDAQVVPVPAGDVVIRSLALVRAVAVMTAVP